MITDMGDGDLVDPDQQGIDESEQAPPGPDPYVADPTAPADESGDGADTERASEVDDVTGPIERPDGGADFGAVDVEALLVELEEFRALAQRLQADFENFRRRASVQAKADAEREASRLAEALLPVLDAAEAAYVQHPDEVGPLLNQMLTELKRHGLEAVDLDGQPFDPEIAEAVHHEPASGGEPVVAEVLRSGYRWKGRTLRPAMVKTTD